MSDYNPALGKPSNSDTGDDTTTDTTNQMDAAKFTINCYAPVFKGSLLFCILAWLTYLPILMALAALIWFLKIFQYTKYRQRYYSVLCLFLKYNYMVTRCREGNEDPNILLL